MLKFDIHSVSFINCIPKVLLVIGNILTSQLLFYLFNIGMTQLIYDLFHKNGGGFKTHITFSMELFVTIVTVFGQWLLSQRATWLMGQGSWISFLKKMLLRLKLIRKSKTITVYIL